MDLKFAFAVNNDGEFQETHFGNADKYLIYEHDSKEMIFINEIINKNKDIDESKKHGSEKKGSAVINYLTEINVNILVSRQFGQNLKMINKHFVPVIIADENIDSTIKFLEKNVFSIYKELRIKETDYNLFRVKNGILK